MTEGLKQVPSASGWTLRGAVLLVRTIQSIPSLMHRYRAVHSVRVWERNVLKDAHSKSECEWEGFRVFVMFSFLFSLAFLFRSHFAEIKSEYLYCRKARFRAR